MMVREILPLPECRAPRYAAVHCRRCDTSSGLRLGAGGEFECSDPKECAANLAGRVNAAEFRARVDATLRRRRRNRGR